jgi:integrase
MRKPLKFPCKVPELAAWRGKIYKSNSRGHDYFKVVYYSGQNGDGRKALGFDSIEATMEGVEKLCKDLGKTEGDSITLGGKEALRYLQALEALKELEHADPINIAVADYAGAKKLLGEVSLREAAQFYVTHHGLHRSTKTVRDVVDELVKEKRGNLSERHVEDLDSRLGRFADDFQCRLAAVTGHQVREWIGSLTGVKGGSKTATPRSLSPRSKNNYLLALQNLVSFAKEKKYLPKLWDELNLSPIKTRRQDVEIFTPDEVEKLLKHANAKLLPYVALGAFAGIRSAELERLDWQKVSLETGYVTIDASIAKTNSRRVIPMSENLRQWLRPYVQKRGPICGYGNVNNGLLKLAAAADVEWKRNGLRHSFGSYRTAQTSDLPRVSYEMGNSPAMVKQHYLELATPEQAQEWFDVQPGTGANVAASGE